MAAQVVLVHLVQVRVLTGLPHTQCDEQCADPLARTADCAGIVSGFARFLQLQRSEALPISARDRPGTHFFAKKVRNELDFSEMNAKLNLMPDAGVAQW